MFFQHFSQSTPPPSTDTHLPLSMVFEHPKHVLTLFFATLPTCLLSATLRLGLVNEHISSLTGFLAFSSDCNPEQSCSAVPLTQRGRPALSHPHHHSRCSPDSTRCVRCRSRSRTSAVWPRTIWTPTTYSDYGVNLARPHRLSTCATCSCLGCHCAPQSLGPRAACSCWAACATGRAPEPPPTSPCAGAHRPYAADLAIGAVT